MSGVACYSKDIVLKLSYIHCDVFGPAHSYSTEILDICGEARIFRRGTR